MTVTLNESPRQTPCGPAYDSAVRQHGWLVQQTGALLGSAVPAAREASGLYLAEILAGSLEVLRDMAPVDQPRARFHHAYVQLLALLHVAERHCRATAAYQFVPILRNVQGLIFTLAWSWGVRLEGMAPEVAHAWIAGRRQSIAC